MIFDHNIIVTRNYKKSAYICIRFIHLFSDTDNININFHRYYIYYIYILYDIIFIIFTLLIMYFYFIILL